MYIFICIESHKYNAFLLYYKQVLSINNNYFIWVIIVYSIKVRKTLFRTYYYYYLILLLLTFINFKKKHLLLYFNLFYFFLLVN